MIKTSPIERSNFIKEEFSSYINSVFLLKDQEYKLLFKEELSKAEIFQGPYLNKVLPFARSKSVKQLIDEGKMSSEFLKFQGDFQKSIDRPLYEHQIRSLERITEGRNVVITTGTGSGKTESFLYPIINEILKEKVEGTINNPGIRALFLYPMNALANDQLRRVRELLSGYSDITFGIYTGETPSDKKGIDFDQSSKLPNELRTREEIKQTPPHILFTNYSMLEYLLIRPGDSHIFLNERQLNNWKFIVLDEAHVYRGASGIEMGLLLRRVTGIAENRIQFILTSATLGRSDDPQSIKDISRFATELTGSNFENKDIVFAERIIPQIESIYDVKGYDYTYIYNNLEDINKVKTAVSKYSDFSSYNDINEILYELLLKDKNVEVLYKTIHNIESFDLLVKQLDHLKQDEIVSLVELIVKARKEGINLFDLKYHLFARTLDGLFVTFSPIKRLKLTRHESIGDLKAFEIANCKHCGTTYIIGKIINDVLYQNKTIDIYENYDVEDVNFKLDFFVVKNDIDESLVDEDEFTNNVEEFVLCNKCGKIHLKDLVNPEVCTCGSEFSIEVYKVNEDYLSRNNVKKCPICNYESKKSGILKTFSIGKDEATALLGQILYQSMGKEQIIEQKTSFLFRDKEVPKKIIPYKKQFIAFSDSRQQASHFASFFEYNHKRFLRKRLLIEALNEANKPLDINTLRSLLENLIKRYNLIEDTSKRKSMSWLTILYDLLYVDGKYGGEGLGLFAFILDFDLDASYKEQLNEYLIDNNIDLYVDDFLNYARNILDIFRINPSIYYNDSMNQDDRDSLEYRQHSVSVSKEYKLGTNDKIRRKNFFPYKNRINKALEYSMKLFKNEEIARFAMETVWNISEENKVFKHVTDGEYLIDIEKYVLHAANQIKFYVCDKCNKVTPYNVKDTCITRGCKGRLNEIIDLDAHFENNYYRREYQFKPIERIDAVEHTGQLDYKKAREYQRDFTDKKLNIISSSTTFEMGLDIGSLDTVFMRNVPPLPSNYIQRSGRAGRSSNTAAFILTYCSPSSHDFTFFNQPKKMIDGYIQPPYFKISNEKMIARHLIAASFGFFFRQFENTAYSESIEELILNNGIDKLIEYLNTKPSNLGNYIDKKILPKDISHYLVNFQWLNRLNIFSKLNDFKDTIINQLEQYEDLNLEFPNSGYGKFIRDIKKGNVISYLSQYNIIPKHGFPVDVVNLEVRDTKTNTKLVEYDLSRQIDLALTEYAPESEVIVDKFKIQSRYIKILKNHSIPKYYYHSCSSCKQITISPSSIEACSCGAINTSGKETFVSPIYGFQSGDISSAETSQKPKRTYSSETVYLNKGTSNNDKKTIISNLGKGLEIETTSDDELLILNTNNFYYCEDCGYTKINNNVYLDQIHDSEGHRTSYGGKCENNVFKRTHLGHILKTDITKITLKDQSLANSSYALSFLNAFLSGISIAFEIELHDIGGTIYQNNQGQFEVIIYDNVPGGAGHSKRLMNETLLKDALLKSHEIVDNSCCDGKTSCYNCLRNYYNQHYHHKLVRNSAKEVIENIIGLAT